MRILLLGKPMSGKGTQAKLLSKALKLRHISSGDLLRSEVDKKSQVGKAAEKYLKRGELVPDELINSLMKKKVGSKGCILDGFPRDLNQAAELDSFLDIDLVVDVEVSDDVIVERCVKRRICEICGAIYGLDFPPKVRSKCDTCGGKLYRRSDDNKRTIKKRLEVYQDLTSPLIVFYKKKKILWRVDGELPVSDIHKKILKKIERIK